MHLLRFAIGAREQILPPRWSEWFSARGLVDLRSLAQAPAAAAGAPEVLEIRGKFHYHMENEMVSFEKNLPGKNTH